MAEHGERVRRVAPPPPPDSVAREERERSRSRELSRGSSGDRDAFQLTNSRDMVGDMFRYLGGTLQSSTRPPPLLYPTPAPLFGRQVPMMADQIDNISSLPLVPAVVASASGAPMQAQAEHPAAEAEPQDDVIKATRLIMIEMAFPPDNTTIITELYKWKGRIKHHEIMLNSHYIYFEFFTVIEALSFMAKDVFSSCMRKQYVNAPALSPTDISRYKVFLDPVDPGDSEVTPSEAVFLISVSMFCCSGLSKTGDRVSSPYKISVFSTNGAFTFSVHPRAILNDEELFQSCLALSKVDGKVFYINQHLEDESQIFYRSFLNMLVNNLKAFGSSNYFDKALLQFECEAAAKTFLDFLSVSENSEAILNSISGIVYAPQDLNHHEDIALLELNIVNIELRSRFMNYLYEKEIDKDQIKSFLDNSVSTESVLYRSSKQVIVAVVVRFSYLCDDKVEIQKISCCSLLPDKKGLKDFKSFQSEHSGEKKAFRDFLELAMNYHGSYPENPLTLLTFTNSITFSVLINAARRLSLLDEFYNTFQNVCDFKALMKSRGKDSSFESVIIRSSDTNYLLKLFHEQVPLDINSEINKYSSSTKTPKLESDQKFPIRVITPNVMTFQSNESCVDVDVDLDFEIYKKKKVCFVTKYSEDLTCVGIDIKERSISVKFISKTTRSFARGSLLGFLFRPPDEHYIPTKLPFLAGIFTLNKSTMQKTTYKETPIPIKSKQKLTEPNLSSSGENMEATETDKTVQRDVQRKRKDICFDDDNGDSNVVKKRKSEDGIRTFNQTPPSILHSTLAEPPEAPTITLDTEMMDVNMKEDPEIVPGPENIIHAEIVKTENKSLQVYLFCDFEDGEVTSLDALISQHSGKQHFRRSREDLQSPEGVISDLSLLTGSTRYQLIMMCPASIHLLHKWILRNIPRTQFFPDQICTLASLINSYKESQAIKATEMRPNRLDIYFQNICGQTLSSEVSKAGAMMKIFEQMSVSKDDWFSLNVIESNGPFLPFFLHADTVNNNLLTLGYYSVDQQSLFLPLRIGTNLHTEDVKSLGFLTTCTFKSKYQERTTECWKEQEALAHLLNRIESDSKEHSFRRPILVTVNKNISLILLEKFKQHNMLSRAFETIGGLASIEEYWELDSNFFGMETIKRFCFENMNMCQNDFNFINSFQTAKLMLDVLCNKLGLMPDFNNFLKHFAHPMVSPYVNSVMQNSNCFFSEDVYKVICAEEVPIIIDTPMKVSVRILGETNFMHDRNVKIDIRSLDNKIIVRNSKTEKIGSGKYSLLLTVCSKTKKTINKGELLGFAVVKPSKLIEKKEGCQKFSKTKNIVVEKTIALEGKEEKEMMSDYILNPEKGTEDLKVDIDIGQQFIQGSSSSPMKLKFSFEKRQFTKNQRIKYTVRNLTSKQVNLRRGTKIGVATFDERQVAAKSSSGLLSKDETLTKLILRYAPYERFIRTLNANCPTVTLESIEDIIQEIMMVVENDTDAIESEVKKHYSPSAAIEEVSERIKNNVESAYLFKKETLKIVSKTYQDLVANDILRNSAMKTDIRVSCKTATSTNMSVNVDQNKSPVDTNRTSKTFRCVPLEKLTKKVENTGEDPAVDTDHPIQAEYMEYMDFPNPHCLKSEDISFEEKCVIDSKNSDTGSDRIKTENRLKESRDNKTFAKIESEAMNNLPSSCPMIPKSDRVKHVKIDANKIDLDLLPVPCPSVSESVKENFMAKIIEDTQYQYEVPHKKATAVKDKEENQEVVNPLEFSETEMIVENVKSHNTGKPEEENKVTFRRASFATSESPTKREISLGEELRQITCPHHDSPMKQSCCLFCNSIRKGKTRCLKISSNTVGEVKKFGFCKHALMESHGCKKKSCKSCHDLPPHLEYPFCKDFLGKKGCMRQYEHSTCDKIHLGFPELNEVLKKEVLHLYEECEICLQEFIEERQQMIEDQNSQKKRRIICTHYQKGKCRFGETCIKEHISPIAKDDKRVICVHYLKGKCLYGSNCIKDHENGDLRSKLVKL